MIVAIVPNLFFKCYVKSMENSGCNSYNLGYDLLYFLLDTGKKNFNILTLLIK